MESISIYNSEKKVKLFSKILFTIHVKLKLQNELLITDNIFETVFLQINILLPTTISVPNKPYAPLTYSKKTTNKT